MELGLKRFFERALSEGNGEKTFLCFTLLFATKGEM